jgi:hypothetical protein
VANKREYLDRLQVAIQELHKCGAAWRETVPVHEVFRGETVWQGEVEVFDLNGPPRLNAVTPGATRRDQMTKASGLLLCSKSRQLQTLNRQLKPGL